MPDTIPQEQYPSDAEIGLLDSQTDAGTGLTYIAKGTNATSSPPYEIQYNRRLHRQNKRVAIISEGLVVDEGGLSVGVYPCHYTLNGIRRRFAGATSQAVPDNATRFVFLDSGGDLQVAAAYPSDVSAHLPLAQVVAANGQLTIFPETGYARLAAPPAIILVSAEVGEQVGEDISIELSLIDAGGNAVAKHWLAEIWLSDTTVGDLTATTPSGGISIDTGTMLGASLSADRHLKIVANASGQITATVTHNAAHTYFLNLDSSALRHPQSFSITFSAS